MSWESWTPYVSVAERRREAAQEMDRLRRKGLHVQPVEISGRGITHTFWGGAWCDHLEKFSDYANRLPRGRTYVRSGAVCHLEIRPGKVLAKVRGSELYDVEVAIRPLPRDRWARVRSVCVGHVGSALELLEGRLTDRVMALVTDPKQGIFPGPREMTLRCSCPDRATMCKHVAAALYGVGARLDQSPELLFRLRGVDHLELVGQAVVKAVVARTPSRPERRVDKDRLEEIFGIDFAPGGETPVRKSRPNASGSVRRAALPPSRAARGRPTASRRSRTSAPKSSRRSRTTA